METVRQHAMRIHGLTSDEGSCLDDSDAGKMRENIPTKLIMLYFGLVTSADWVDHAVYGDPCATFYRSRITAPRNFFFALVSKLILFYTLFLT
jgi:hypothetical protein